jgi:putative PIN family toxin of toxin-antitoxin system
MTLTEAAHQRVAFDTNVLVSALLFHNSSSAVALQYAFAHGRVLISDLLLRELTTVLLREKFNRYVDLDLRMGFVQRLQARGELITTTSDLHECRDSKDNFVLNLAVDGKAELIITGDADLLGLDPFRGSRILSPSEYLQDTWKRGR